jgi:hypothetical protein
MYIVTRYFSHHKYYFYDNLSILYYLLVILLFFFVDILFLSILGSPTFTFFGFCSMMILFK